MFFQENIHSFKPQTDYELTAKFTIFYNYLNINIKILLLEQSNYNNFQIKDFEFIFQLRNE